MYEEYAKANALIFKISSICSIILAVLFLTWVISLFAITQPDAQNSPEENLRFVAKYTWQFCSGPFIMFLFTLIQIPIIISLFLLTRRSQYLLSNLGGIMGLIYIIFCSQTYFRLFTAIPRLARIYTTSGNELEKYAIIANFNGWGHLNSHSLALNQDMLGYTFLGFMCILFGISLIGSIKLRSLAGWLLLTGGFVSMLGIIGYIIQHSIVELGSIAAGVIYFFACIAMIPMFFQEAQVLKAIAEK